MSDTAEPSASHVIKSNKSSKNKISEIKKLSIDSTLWTKLTETVLLDDIDLNKLSIKGKYISIYLDMPIDTLINFNSLTIIFNHVVEKGNKFIPEIHLDSGIFEEV